MYRKLKYIHGSFLLLAEEQAESELTLAHAAISKLEAEGSALRNELRDTHVTIAKLEETVAHQAGGVLVHAKVRVKT